MIDRKQEKTRLKAFETIEITRSKVELLKI